MAETNENTNKKLDYNPNMRIEYFLMQIFYQLLTEKDEKVFFDLLTKLELGLAGWSDEAYKIDKFFNDKLYQSSGNSLIWREKRLESLSCLMKRIIAPNDIYEDFLINSKVCKEIAHNISSGIGQNTYITGKPGSGKSYTGLAIALEVAKNTGVPFLPEYICFYPKEVTNLLYIKKIPKGATILWDEIGITMGHRDTAKKINKVLLKMFETVRYKSVNLIMTAPDLSFLDLGVRKLLHWWFETREKDQTRQVVRLKPHIIEIDQLRGEILYTLPRYGNQLVTGFTCPKIDSTWSCLYEQKSRDFKEGFGENVHKMVVEESDLQDK
jgi:hypothetical protein